MTKYVIDPTGLGNVAAEYDGNGNLVTRYDNGLRLVSRVDAAGIPDFYTFSAIGNTSELTGNAGTVVNTYAYDPFGISLSKSEAVENSFEFVGEYGVMDEGSGLEFMRERFYDTITGRFFEQDPIGLSGGNNLYSYANNKPQELVDPRGTFAFDTFPMDLPMDHIHIDPWEGQDPPHFSDPFHPVPSPYCDDGGNCIPVLRPVPDPGPFLRPSPDPGPFLRPAPPLDPPFNPAPNNPNLIPQPDPRTPTPLPPPNQNPERHDDTSVTSADPNDKHGPGGYGEGVYVTSGTALAYQVQFENESDASAPARLITVTDRLDEDLDLDSLQLNEITFADQSIAIPTGLDHFETTVPFNANGTPIMVGVVAGLNRTTRELTLSLSAIDPQTGWFPEDPLIGFLYPNDSTGRGQGSISYSISPKAGLPSGTVINNRAKIVFDFNDPIDTPEVHNTLDTTAPSSSVATIPVTTSTEFTVNWSGSDEAGGSGIATYDVYIAVDATPFALWIAGTKTTSATIKGESSRTYAFYSIATDNVGHRQGTPAAAQASILILPLTWKNPLVPTDVDEDGSVSPLDVLTLINQINRGLSSDVLPAPSAESRPAPFFDVDGDGRLTPLDVLIVINFINAQGSNGEGESAIISETNKPFPIAATTFNFSAEGRLPSISELVKNRVRDQDPLTIGRERKTLVMQSTAFALPVPFVHANRLAGNESAKKTKREQTSGLDEALLEILAGDIQPHFH